MTATLCSAPSMRVLATMPDGAERHGLDLLRDTGLPARTLYVALVRLERAGLVESRWTASGRRGYRPTADGLAVAVRCPVATAAPRQTGWWLAVFVIAI